MAKKIPRVALLIETSSAYGRRILSGIDRYLRAHSDWSIYLEQRSLTSEIPVWLAKWKGDGIITRSSTEDLVQAVRKSGTPLVELTDRHEAGPIPRIYSDDQAIGKLAAEHLMERGFEHFGFCGFAREAWSYRRKDSFCATLTEAGHECDNFESPWHGSDVQPWESEQESLTQWVRGLPKPIGIFASNDLRALHLLNACREIDVSVPEELAVLGVDNDELLCDLCRPTLSSIVPNPEEIGYLAAQLLDDLIHGEQVTEQCRQIEPIGVATRQSTDIFAIDDPDVATAVRLIRENACDGITVQDILKEVPLSRSALERRFRKHFKRSPQAEIRNAQLKRVKQLLAETDFSLPRIATIAGFEHPEYMSVVFKRRLGSTPGEYRLRVRRAVGSTAK